MPKPRKRFLYMDLQLQVIQDSDSPYVAKVKSIGVIPILNQNLSQSIIEEFEERMKTNTLGTHGMLNYMQALTKSFYSEENLIHQIQQLKFDMIICGAFLEAQFIANTLQIPLYIRILTGNPDTMMQVMLKQHTSHSSQLHAARTSIFGMEKHPDFHTFSTNFFTRLRNRLAEYIIGGIGLQVIHYQLEKQIPDHLKLNATVHRAPDMILYTGYEGLSPPLPLSSNSRIIPPIIEAENGVQDIPQDLQDFMNKHEKLILVSFGSVQNPTNETLREISKFMQKSPDYGFIYSTRNKRYFQSEIFETIQSLDNVYIAKWLPQTQILNNPKVQIFFTHGGQQSYIESIEAGKPMIVIPVFAPDQFFACEYVQMQKLGACMYKPDVDHLVEIVRYVEQNNGFRDRLLILKKMIEKKKNQGLDMLYWVDYLMEIGTSEFITSKQYQWFNNLQLYDADVNIAIDIIIIAIAATIITMLVKIYRLATCKKDKKESKSIKIE
ncbi:antennal-enriched udp-glycosyltransferase [Stylonychia lemnae]|uniref:Antennal-enriched udp-glycosyltransferase n=1 Tax=Stylonychia lemnae TaxID=5949 RepID=A0A078ASD0_STYLE|nr:antennal-enriched udp-glycosyltransferase [Stylonychia lemnae]|eukprot:CDW85084.1 antennal-enriched udp-glycosyltransferase [Stylonychia lemnae]